MPNPPPSMLLSHFLGPEGINKTQKKNVRVALRVHQGMGERAGQAVISSERQKEMIRTLPELEAS